MSTFRKALFTALVALFFHAALIAVKAHAHPSRSILSVFHLGGAQAVHPAFVAAEGYPLDPHGYGTDGQQYLYVAHDPLALGGEMARSIDAPHYRYGRILLPAVAWLACAGNSPCIPRAIIVANLAFAAGIGAVTAILVAETGAAAWWAVVLACSGSLACATELGNVELGAQFFGLLGVLLVARGRSRLALLAWALAALARESYVLLPIGFAVATILPALSAYRAKQPAERRLALEQGRRASLFLLAPLPRLVWTVYLSLRLPPQAANGAATNLSPPLFGILEHVASFVRAPRITGSTVITVAVAVPLLFVMTRHTRALRIDRSGLAMATFLFVLMGIVASPIVWVRAGGFGRALDFIYPGAMVGALKRGDRTTAFLAATTLLQTFNILFDYLLVPIQP